MDKTEAQVVLEYLQKNGMITKYIHENMVQILAEDFPAKNWAVKFKQGK